MTFERESAALRRKVKTQEELREMIGARPRRKRVIMCHGAFDLVHPGHVRHLLYAKSKADILVVSITSDAHISKAPYRPFVPQDLRALNLAALEMVDYVIIDPHPTPIDNILFLQPDYFAKGQEYHDDGIHPRTKEEMRALDSYGGELLFTPGDVVFSSSAFIEQAKPDISPAKLSTLMEAEGVTFDSLRKVVRSFEGLKVHVLGDTIVDSYIYCTPIGTSTSKTPTLSVRMGEQRDFVGGAAVVARHLAAAGARVTFSTVLGDDPLKELVLREMKAHGIDCRAEIDSTRPTTQKNAFLASGHRLLKVDRVDNRTASDRIVDRLRESVASSDGVDAFVFSDFRHGIFDRRTIPLYVEALPEGPLRIADSQVASRWGNILEFQGFDLVTPNEREARFALGDQDTVIRPLALELYRRAGCKILILKLGDRGVLTYRQPSEDVRAFFTIDSFARRVVDAMGAGDALLGYATLSLKVTGSAVDASILGSVAAGIACEHEGNEPVSPVAVLERLDAMERHAGVS